MAKKLGEAYVELTTRGQDRMMRTVRGLKSKIMGALGIMGAGAAVYGFGRLLKGAVDEAVEAEHADKMLAAMLDNVKTAAKGSAKGLIEYANELQTATSYDEEFIKHAMTQLATFQLNEKQIKAITPRILDMAAALEQAGKGEQDLHQIAIAVGKAFTGQFGALRRYGVIMTDADMKASSFARKLEILDENYRGASDTLSKTYLGSLRQLRNEWNQLKELIGVWILPQVKKLTASLTELFRIIRGEPKAAPALDMTWAGRKARLRTQPGGFREYGRMLEAERIRRAEVERARLPYVQTGYRPPVYGERGQWQPTYGKPPAPRTLEDILAAVRETAKNTKPLSKPTGLFGIWQTVLGEAAGGR